MCVPLVLTERDYTICHLKIWGIRLVVNVGGLSEQVQQLLGINEVLVDGSVDVSEHVERAVELQDNALAVAVYNVKLVHT